MDKGERRIVEFALLGVLALLWGSSYLFIKVAVTEIPPFTLIAARVSIAACFLGLVVFWRRERLPRDTKTWRRLLIQSFLNAIGAWTILAWGQQYVDSGLAGVLNSTSPIFVFFLTLFISRHEATSFLRLAGAILGLIGVVLIVGLEALQGLGSQVAGQLAALTGAFLYACVAIHGKRFAHLSAPVTATGTMLWATLFLVPLCLIVDRPWTLSPSAEALWATLALSVLSTGVALIVYFRLVRTLGSLGVASQAYLRAGVSVVLGVVVLGEVISPLVGLGLLAALFGVAAINAPLKWASA
jgi:drug/metabolite transporter (DMT)-like permease